MKTITLYFICLALFFGCNQKMKVTEIDPDSPIKNIEKTEEIENEDNLKEVKDYVVKVADKSINLSEDNFDVTENNLIHFKNYEISTGPAKDADLIELNITLNGLTICQEVLTRAKAYYKNDSKDTSLFIPVYDNYSGRGLQFLVIYLLDAKSKNYVNIEDIPFDRNQLLKRNTFYIDKAGFDENLNFKFHLIANFPSSSGHPGIDAGLKEEYGELFEKDDPIDLGYFKIEKKF